MFFAALDGLPGELVNQFRLLAQKDAEYEGSGRSLWTYALLFNTELRRSLFKKRNLLLKAQEKDVDLQMQATLRRKAEKDHQKAVLLIEEKIEMEKRLQLLVMMNEVRKSFIITFKVESHLDRLNRQVSLKLNNIAFKPPIDLTSDIPDPQTDHATVSNNTSEVAKHSARNRSTTNTRSSPKKR